MIDVPPVTATGNRLNDKPFLSTHRALSACTRELARLTTCVLSNIAELRRQGVEETPVVRQSPDRCIVQVGPVALTMTWLRSTLDSVANGELLVIVWRGEVAPRDAHYQERPSAPRAPAAVTAVWEEALVAVAANADTWTWSRDAVDGEGYTSAELAGHCVERLRLAYAAS